MALGHNITFPIKNSDGTSFHDLVLHKAAYDSVVMSLGDKITGDVYYRDNHLAVTMGEYIEYDGVKFVLVNPPTVVREGMVSDNGDLRGMTKYSFEFFHPMCMLSNFPFSDVAVTNDEKRYLSDGKTFSWIGTCFDLIAKLNKNLELTEWVVVPTDNQESLAKMAVLSEVMPFDKNTIADVLKKAYETWKVPFVISSLKEGDIYDGKDYYADGKRFVIIFGLPSNEIIDKSSAHGTTVNATSVATSDSLYYADERITVPRGVKILVESLTEGATPVIYNDTHNGVIGTTNRTFGQDTVVYVGLKGASGRVRYSIGEESSNVFIFRYGQDVGLKNNSRTPKNNKIVTRIAAQGSEGNIPFGYPQIPWYGTNGRTCTYGNDVGVYENVTIDGHTFPKVVSYPIYKGVLGGAYVELVKHPFTRSCLMPSVYHQCLFNKVSLYLEDGSVNTDYDPDIELVDYYDADGSYPNPIVPSAPSYETHEFNDIKPRLGEASIVNAVPYNSKEDDAENIAREDLEDWLYDKIDESTNENEKTQLGAVLTRLLDQGEIDASSEHFGGSYTYRWSVKKKAAENKYRVEYTSSSLNFKYNAWEGDIPTSVWDDTTDDNGEPVQSHMKITLPVLSFDLYASAALTEEMTINMRSGACVGCSFPVEIDWEDYKKVFWDEDGNFVPDGEKRLAALERYPYSNQGEITVIARKDLDTFGKLMPNIYQQPVGGDKFVILGISLPESYIESAEQELDDAMKEYMSENNVYYFDYPLKFDEYFLATHTDILEQIRPNTIVRFVYGGDAAQALYVKQLTIRYGDSPLPKYDITLTDDVEVVLNQIGQVTDDVSRMRVQVSELQKYYSANIESLINDKLSKVADDVALGKITFQQGIISTAKSIFHDVLQSSDFASGLYDGRGWRIDELGNAEFESIRARSFLEVVELIINRLQAQEGDTLFTDNDQIERVEKRIDETEGSVSFILSLKEKWDGYVTSQMYGNVLKGIINTLAAKQGGVSDETNNNPSKQGTDDGGNKYYTSWMRVIATHNTDPQLGVNQIRVVLFGDDEVPAQKNFEPCELMTVARWGCRNYADPSDPNYETIKASIERRQRLFMISVTDGRVVKYTGVDAPILKPGNYGVTIGELPDFVKNYPSVQRVMQEQGISEHSDWLYAQGVVVANFVKVNKAGLPQTNIVYCGEWVDGSVARTITINEGTENEETVTVPSVRYGIYLYNEYNADEQQYETHQVTHRGNVWQCLQHQPVTSGGTQRYYEPTWNSSYWMLVNGSETLSIQFVSSRGYSFRHNAVDTVITPHLFYGDIDITDDVVAEYWNWTRHEEANETVDPQTGETVVTYTPQDESWNTRHQGVKVLQLSNLDMPDAWSFRNKTIFTVTVSVNDGKTTRIVENQIVS